MTSQSRRKRLSAEAYQALRNALPVIVWYKKQAFKPFLRAALRDHPELLARLDFEGATKRETADELIERLIDGEDKYQATTIQLMLEIANMERFPDLERHEDAERLIAQAKAAVAELRRHTKQYESLLNERERLEAERVAQEQQVALRRKFTTELDELRQRFLDMHQLQDVHARGREFEPFLNRLFDLFDLEPRLSYNLAHEQIDGAFSFDTDDYIVEARWRQDKVSREQADAFAAKVSRKGKNALGLMVSVNGFTRDALQVYSQGTPFMTIDGPDLFCVLEGRARLDDVLGRKKRYANETGECYFPISRIFE